MTLTIRQATNKDCKDVQRLVFGVLEEYGLAPDSAETDKDLFDFNTFYFNNNGYFSVVIEEEEIVASFGVLKLSETTCELRKMFALPKTRGKGLGKKLLQLAIDKARSLGYQKMVLQTASPLKEAMGLYEKFGFSEYESDELASRCDKAYELLL